MYLFNTSKVPPFLAKVWRPLSHHDLLSMQTQSILTLIYTWASEYNLPPKFTHFKFKIHKLKGPHLSKKSALNATRKAKWNETETITGTKIWFSHCIYFNARFLPTKVCLNSHYSQILLSRTLWYSAGNYPVRDTLACTPHLVLHTWTSSLRAATFPTSLLSCVYKEKTSVLVSLTGWAFLCEMREESALSWWLWD